MIQILQKDPWELSAELSHSGLQINWVWLDAGIFKETMWTVLGLLLEVVVESFKSYPTPS